MAKNHNPASPHRKLHAAWQDRRAAKNRFPKLTQEVLAEELSKRMEKPISHGALRTYLTDGKLDDATLLTAAEEYLELEVGWLVNGKDDKPQPLEGLQTSTKRSYRDGKTGYLANVTVFKGGSSRMWVMDDGATERIEVYKIPGEQTEYVKVHDGTLWPYATVNEILTFERTADRVPDVVLLVCRRDDPKTCAIRAYDPDADEGAGAFIDPRGVNDPLPVSEWEVRGIATESRIKSGIPMKKLS